MKRINYRYEKNSVDNQSKFVGFDLVDVDDNRLVKKGYYVGMTIPLSDAVTPFYRDLLGIKDLEMFLYQYKRYQAVGIIYFPSTHTYGFLEENDTVFSNYEELKQKLNAFCLPLELEQFNKCNEYEELLDPADSLVELCDLRLTREKASAR